MGENERPRKEPDVMIVVILVVIDLASFWVPTILGDFDDPSLGCAVPGICWYGWTATAAMGALELGLIATFLPEQWTRRRSRWNGCGVVPASAMLVCVNPTMPWFRL